jgi:hypothetical protein
MQIDEDVRKLSSGDIATLTEGVKSIRQLLSVGKGLSAL